MQFICNKKVLSFETLFRVFAYGIFLLTRNRIILKDKTEKISLKINLITSPQKLSIEIYVIFYHKSSNMSIKLSINLERLIYNKHPFSTTFIPQKSKTPVLFRERELWWN